MFRGSSLWLNTEFSLNYLASGNSSNEQGNIDVRDSLRVEDRGAGISEASVLDQQVGISTNIGSHIFIGSRGLEDGNTPSAMVFRE